MGLSKLGEKISQQCLGKPATKKKRKAPTSCPGEAELNNRTASSKGNAEHTPFFPPFPQEGQRQEEEEEKTELAAPTFTFFCTRCQRDGCLIFVSCPFFFCCVAFASVRFPPFNGNRIWRRQCKVLSILLLGCESEGDQRRSVALPSCGDSWWFLRPLSLMWKFFVRVRVRVCASAITRWIYNSEGVAATSGRILPTGGRRTHVFVV